MIDLDAYERFLRAKAAVAPRVGTVVAPADVSRVLRPHQRLAVQWMVDGGRRACFAAFGLGKSLMQLEAVRLARERAGGRGLIILPLGVRQEFVRDAALIDVPVQFIRRIEEARSDEPVYLTNYETVRDGKLDPREFAAVSLDEAAVLRGFGGTKTFREFMATIAGDDRAAGVRTEGIPYRFVATATPSPNEYIELLAYAAFLGVMDVGQAKTRFFRRNSEKADQLTLHPHKEREFWLWVASWALFVQKPSDLDPSFSDEGYDLPPLDVRWHELPSDHAGAGAEKDGQGRLFRNATIGVQDAAREKRESMPARMAKVLELRAEDPGAHRIIWHDLEDERRALERELPRARYGRWSEYLVSNPTGLALYERHYSAIQYQDGRERDQFTGPGEKTVLLTDDGAALFVWRKFVDDSGQTGVNCAIFRNEGPVLSSDLIREAMAIAWQRWPGQRFYTYVDERKVRSANPGYCFKMAGWRVCGRSKSRDLLILEALPGCTELPDIERQPGMVAVYGSQEIEEREQHVIAFSEGRIPELAGKPVMLGSGCNFQRFCHWAIFMGIGFKFADFIQAIHRLYRFLQTDTVRIDLIYTEAERDMRQRLERRWRQHNEMVNRMTEIIREYGLAHAALDGMLERSLGVERVEASGDGYTVVNNDCVLEAAQMADDSVDLIVTSIPFATQYEYTPSYNDFGHTDDNEHFWEQMDFLIPSLLRVLKPGRVACIHVKDRITPGGINGLGFQTVAPFSDECIAAFQRHGFAFLSRVTIVTDVVRENNQTYRLGWTEQCKDGSRMGNGMPEYLLKFRKPPTDLSNGYADVPVVKSKANYTRARWQYDAHGFWRSSGDRPLMPEDLDGLEQSAIFQLYRKHSLADVYDFRHAVRIAEHVDQSGWLPTTFMLLQPQSWHPEVWTDITRMRTLNSTQAAKGKEQHLCPLQFDIVDRCIEQHSMAGELVFDPFGGLGTVPYCALKQKRSGYACELNPAYYLDMAAYCAGAARDRGMPGLFDAIDFSQPMDKAA